MPNQDKYLDRLRKVADGSLNLNLSAEELESFNRLDEAAGMDSLSLLEFISGVEKEFGVTLAEDELRIEVLADLPALAGRLKSRC
jgi:acyl carrier protein